MDIYHDGTRLPVDEPQDNFEPDWLQEHLVIQCRKCGGHAWNLGDYIDCENCGKMKLCSRCDGVGEIDSGWRDPGWKPILPVSCPDCSGTGYVQPEDEIPY